MQQPLVVQAATTNAPQYYKRSADSPWVCFPRCSNRSISQFMVNGTWVLIRTELGDLIQNGRSH